MRRSTSVGASTRRVGPTRHGLVEFPLPRTLAPHSVLERHAAGANGEASRAADLVAGGLATASGRIMPWPTVAQQVHRALLERHTPASVVVDRSGHVLYYHGDTAPFLTQPAGEPTRDLLELARDHVRTAVRAALHKALDGDGVALVPDGTITTESGKQRIVVGVEPLDAATPATHYLVSFRERPEPPPAPVLAVGDADGQAVMAGELQRVQDELQSTIEELQTSNEELKAANEEVTSVNEELQSTNEELETSKEELQSLNEELSTVNAQLQAKMDELERTSSDLSSLLTSTDIATIFLDTSFRIRRFTPAMRNLVEFIPGDVGRPLADLARKFTDPNLVADAEAVLDKLVPIEREISGQDGRHFLRRVLPYRTADNRIGGTVIVFVDITARTAAEARLRESEARFRTLADVVPDLLWCSDAAGNVTWLNQRWLDYTGQTTGQAERAGWVEAIHPDDRGWSQEGFRQAVSSGADLKQQYRLRGVDGEYRWFLVRARPLRDESGRVLQWFGAATDIHEQRTALDALRQSEERYRALLESANDYAILTTDAAGRITTWNRGAAEIFGHAAEEAIGRPAAMIFTPEDRAGGDAEAEMQTARRDGRSADERWHLRKDGSKFWGSGVMAALHAPDGESDTAAGFVKILRDATEQYEAAEATDEARRVAEAANAAKDDFLANVSHELRTPLSAILLWGKMLQAEAAKGRVPEQNLAEGLDAIARSATAQQNLIDDLLDTTRIAAGKVRLNVRHIVLPEVVSAAVESIRPAATAKGLTLESTYGEHVDGVMADPDRIQQIVWNLLSNAVKFTPVGGRVTLGLWRHGDEVQVVVTDTGRGIEPDAVGRIFDRFGQVGAAENEGGPRGGLGLGLAICRQLVEMHGGTIAAVSQGPGRGSTFTVTLPLPPVPKAEPDERERDAGVDPDAGKELEIAAQTLRGRRVLLVEDDATMTAALTATLVASGASVKTAKSAEEALRQFDAERPDVILSDIGLAGGTDGNELMRRLRLRETSAGLAPTPAVAISAFARDRDRRKAGESGFDTYLPKPVDPAQLVATLAGLLE